MVGSSTPWKATAPSPTVPTVWLACARKRRGYLWGGLHDGGSTLGGGSWGGIGEQNRGTMGGTLLGAWGSVLRCSRVIYIVARVRLGGRVGVGVGAPVAVKMSASCQKAYMVWAQKRVKGAVSAGFARASARCMDASMAA